MRKKANKIRRSSASCSLHGTVGLILFPIGKDLTVANRLPCKAQDFIISKEIHVRHTIEI